MTRNRLIAFAAAFGATFGTMATLTTAAQAGKSPLGVWMNDTGRGAIEITECGSKLCGHVVWTKSSKDRKKGCGKQIIGNLKKVSGSLWDNGWIYSPEKKRKYDVEVKPLSKGRLRVKGYKGVKFFSKTMIWKRAPDDLNRCDGKGSVIAASSERQERKSYDDRPVTKPRREERTRKPVEDEVVRDERDSEPEEEVADAGGSPLEDLDLGKYFKKTDDGDCNLNTPWIKLRFKCDD